MKTAGMSVREKRYYYLNHSPSGKTCCDCIMDDTDPEITFDDNGRCYHCDYAESRLRDEKRSGPEGELLLRTKISEIKQQGMGHDYDCVIGISGGVDSSYVAWLCKKKFNLRPLAIHLDNGWNSELAVKNIQSLLENLDIDLFTHVIEWEEMRDLQRSMIQSGTANLEVITDHAINAILFREAAKFGVRTIITGANVDTESMHLAKWHYDNRDAKFIKAIHSRFGKMKLKTYPLMSFQRLLWYTFGRKIRTLPVLNYVQYNKEDAKALLNMEMGWRPYDVKHGESIFTHFLQHIYLPQRFGFDKRKLHYSCLIASGQLTRNEALEEMNKPLFIGDEDQRELDYVLKKLDLSTEEWERILKKDKKYFFDYPNMAWALNYDNPVVQFVRDHIKNE